MKIYRTSPHETITQTAYRSKTSSIEKQIDNIPIILISAYITPGTIIIVVLRYMISVNLIARNTFRNKTLLKYMVSI